MQKQSKKVRALKCEIKPISVSFNSPRRKKRQYSHSGVAVVVVVSAVGDFSLYCPTRPAATSGDNVSGRGVESHPSSGLMKPVQSESRFHTASGGRCFDALHHARALLSRWFWWWWRTNVEISLFSFPQ